MQVLVKNPLTSLGLESLDLLPSFWDPDCFYPGDDFSFTSLLELSDPHGLSPFFFLDARIAFMVSQLSCTSAYLRGLGSLGSVAAFTRIDKGEASEESHKLEKYFQEYFLEKPPFLKKGPYQQIVTFGERVLDEDLWEKLEVGGFYIMGSVGRPIEVPRKSFEAFGKLWPFGAPTEFGWCFQEPDLGLHDFFFSKFKKLDSGAVLTGLR